MAAKRKTKPMVVETPVDETIEEMHDQTPEGAEMPETLTVVPEEQPRRGIATSSGTIWGVSDAPTPELEHHSEMTITKTSANFEDIVNGAETEATEGEMTVVNIAHSKPLSDEDKNEIAKEILFEDVTKLPIGPGGLAPTTKLKQQIDANLKVDRNARGSLMRKGESGWEPQQDIYLVNAEIFLTEYRAKEPESEFEVFPF